MFLSRGLVCPFSSACFRWIILFARPDRSSWLFSLLSPFPLFVLTIGQKGVLLISLIVCLLLVAYPVGTGVQEKDPDLAVLPAPSCPAVLPRYSRRLLPFLDEARFIHHQDPVCLSQLLDHVGLQFI